MLNKANGSNTTFLQLKDGRRLCYSEYGALDGYPVLYNHGFPGSRLEAQLLDTAAKNVGARLVAVDRPGYGGSDYLPNRKIGDWPGDIARLMEHLGLNQFAVLGVSGGGPYAVACAQTLSAYMTALGLVCALGSMDEVGSENGMGLIAARMIDLMRRSPRMTRWLYANVIGPFMRRYPEAVLAILAGKAPQADKQVLKEPQTRGICIRSAAEAFHHGGRGPAWDLFLYTQPSGTELSAITVDTLLWHGAEDRTVPVAMGYHYAEQIPNCAVEIIPREGHFSLTVRWAETILGALMRTAKYNSEAKP